MTLVGLTIDPPLVLAPMAGVTSMPFRLLCRRAGAGLVCSEMVSANAIAHGNRKTDDLLISDPAERPLSVQVFGSDPATMAQAARYVEAAGADVIDINMGCPVRKVVRTGAGVALAADPDRAVAVAEACVRAVSVPVTVKMRAGRSPGDLSYVDLACRLADVGVAAVTLHARTARQGYRGSADWTAIARLAEALPIPVIGNGGVLMPDDAVRMVRGTGCAAVMIARGALGNPFLFRQAARALRDEPAGETPPRWRLAAALWHAQALVLHAGEYLGVRQMRAQAAWYTRGMPGSHAFRRAACGADTLRELADAMLGLLGTVTAPPEGV
jgi:tRNA-dihydrouridine synthase B